MKLSTFHCALRYILLYMCTLPMLVKEVLVEARYPLPDGNQLKFAPPPRTGLGGVVDDYAAGGVRQGNVLIKYGNITDWDMSQVTNLNYIFADDGKPGLLGANAQFNGDVSFWNTSGVTTMIGSKLLDVLHSTCVFHHAIAVSLLSGNFVDIFFGRG